MAAAKGIIISKDRTRLAEFGGHITLTEDWAKSPMNPMGFVKRRTTKSKSIH